MSKLTLNDSGGNRTRKTKRWLGWLSFCMMIFAGQMSSAQYCTPVFPSGCASGDQINNFEIPTASFSHLATGCSTGAYGDFTSMTINLYIGASYDFTVTHGFSSQHIRIWIDFNDDEEFDDSIGSTELVAAFSSTGSGTATITNGTIVIPSSVSPGTYRMRVADRYSSQPIPCNTLGFGETHDYTVQISAPPPCAFAPGDLTAINVTWESANLSWEEPSTATSWDIEWGLSGFTPTGTPIISGTTSNPYALTGLDTATAYDFYVRSDCGGGDLSPWAGPYTFQTTADCSAYVGGITSVTNGSICNIETSTTLQAVATGTGTDIYWYDSEFGGNLVGEGASFDTPELTETTSYWAAEVLLNNNLLTGQAFANPTVFTNSTSNTGGVLFTVTDFMKIVDVQVFGTNATGGDITIELRDVDNGNITIATATATITGGGTAASPIPHTIPLDFYVPPGNYRLVRTAANPTGVGMGYVSAANSSFPYPLGSSGSVTGGATATGTSTLQYFFFNWTIEEINILCESDREEVIATLHEIEVTATETIIDFGDSTTLSVSSNNTNFTYEWTWNGGTATGTSVTVSPAEHTTYTVTATDTVTNCQTSQEIEILVYNMTLCDDIEILTTTDASVCGEGTTTILQATASGAGDNIYWYDAAVDGNLVGQGASFETPPLINTTSYWAAEVYLDGETIDGVGIVTPSGTGTNSTVGYGIQFTVTESTTLVSVDVLSTANGGDLTIGLYDVSNSTYIASHVETITAGQYHTIPLNFEVPAAGTYRLVRQAQSATIALRSQNTTGTAYPYPIGTIGQLDGGHLSLTGATNAGQYMFYNWSFTTALVICESEREEVTATVYDVFDIDVTATETTIDFGDSTTLTASSTNTGYTYEWTWDGGTPLTGASVTVSPTVHTIYTVTATDTVSGCQVSEEIEILVYNMTLCNTMEITDTTDGNICDEGTVVLSATSSGGGSEIYWYDAAVEGNKVGQGASFETPELTETTSYWAAEVYLDGTELPGQGWLTDYGTNGVGTNRQGLIFEIFEPTTLVDLEVWSTGTGGVVDIELYDIANVVVGNHLELVTTTLATGTTTSPAVNTVTLNWELTPGVYKIVRAGSVSCRYISGVANFGGGYPIPFDDGIGQITAGSNTFASTGFATAYYYFFNWTLSSTTIICESEREEATATVHETIGIDVTATNTELLPGQSSTLSVSSTNSNYTYEWTWDGGSATGASVTVSPTAISTIYTVTATDTVTGCQAQESIEIFTFDIALCDDLEIATTTDGNVCDPGNTTTLQATGSSGIADAQIFWYDAPTGGNKVGTGPTFTTPALTATTSYYAAEVLTDGGGIGGTISTSYTAGAATYFDAVNGAGITFAVQNTNSEPVTLDGLDFYMENITAVGGMPVQDYQLWYHSTNITGAPGIINTANGWISIAGPLNVLPAEPVTGIYPVFTGIDFEIPANTTYRFILTGTGVGGFTYYNATSAPNSFSSEGINLLIGNNTAGGTGNVGYSGQNPYTTGIATTPRFFHGNLIFNSATILCESDREEVIATVHEIIDIDVTATETTIDAGDSTTLTASSTNPNYTYEWTWDGGTPLTGASVVVSPTVHTIFTVTATDTVTGCQTSGEIEILVYDLTLCDDIEILTTTDGSICNDGTVILSATASGDGDEIYWYDAPTGGNKVGQGTTFETPELTETTSFWASEVYLDGGMIGGQAKELPNSTTGYTLGAGLAFTATESFTIADVTLYSNSTAGGTIPSIQLQTITGTLIAEVNNIPVPAAPGTGVNALPFQVPLNIDVPGPGDYRLLVVGSVPSLIRDSGATQAGTFPYPLGTSGEITGSILGVAAPTLTTYYYFYNWTVSTAIVICESDREEVTATVHTIDIAATATTIDPGDSTTLTASSTNLNYEYVWTWDGGTFTGASMTVTPATHTTYTVTATDTTDPTCQNSAEITIIVFNTSLCNMLEITSTTDNGICEEGTTVLQATGGGTGDNIYWYDAPTGGNLVGTGANFTTPSLTTTTSFWASEVLLENGGGTLTGQAKLEPTSATPGGYTLTAGLEFTATETFTIVDVEAYSYAASGTTIPSIQLQDSAGNMISQVLNVSIPNGGAGAAMVPFTIPLNFEVPGPGTYRLMATGSFSSLARDSGATNAAFPHSVGDVAVINQGILTANSATSYYYFYNWTVSSGLVLCESDREEVIATVVPASTTPVPTGPANQLVYAGTTFAGLDVTGTNLTWYSDAALANEISDTELVYEGTYYVTQTIGYCEGSALAITVTLHCPTPNTLSTGTVTLNSAVLTWQGNGISSDIEWGLEGFSLGTGTQVTDISGTSYLLEGLSPDTHYDFYVRQDCGTDGISNWGGPYTFFTGYCEVTSTSTNYGISNFTTTGGVLNINNSSGPGSYSNYTAQSVAQFEGGAPVQFTITSANSTAGMGVWIDWNNNMVFDAGEHIYNSAAYVASGSGSITVPAGTPLGNYRMRVVANFLSQNPTACDFLGSTSAIYGEAEDYTFMVIDPPACMPPIELTADVTAMTADLGWTSTGALFDIKWGASGFDVDTQGTLIEGVANPYTLSGLDPQTTYQYYVRRDCTIDDDGYSLWAGPFTFTTLCVPVSVLNENFDGVTAGTGVLPVCWSKIGTSAAYVNTTSPYSAPNNLYMYKSTNIDNYLVSPYLDNLADNTHWLKFRARTTSTSATTLTVGYLTDATDSSTFVEIETITFVGTAYPSEDFIIFPWNLPVGAKHIAFRNNINLRTIYLDDIRWEAAPTCMYPMNLNAANVSATSTSLFWAGTGTLYDIEYGLQGFTQGAGTTVSGVGNPYTLTGLTGGVAYQYYVRQDCGDGDYSAWSGPHTFTPGAYSGNIPTMFNANPQVTDDACATSFSIEVPDGYYLSALNVQYVMNSWNTAFQSHQRSVLYSPTLNMGEAEVVAGTTDFPGLVPYNRDVTFANGATGTIEFQLKAWRTANGSGCSEAHVYVMEGSWILDAEFELIPTCPEPTDLTYTATSDSVDLMWTADPDTSVFDIQWGLPGFDPELNAGTTVSGLTTTTHTLSDLDSSIVYEFYVRSNCSTDDEDDFSAWVGPVKFNAGYCIPSSTLSYYISTFLTTVAETNISYYSSAINGSGYGDKTDMVVSQAAGTSFNFSSNYVGGQSGLRIWVDWNNDLVFEDSEEMFYLGSMSGTKTGSITIPSDQAPGNYVMRVRVQQGATSIPSACGNVEFGEALDFTLNVSCSGVVLAPTGDAEQTLDLGDTLADLTITGEVGAVFTWYSDADLTTEISDTTEAVDGATYWVTQTVGDCTSDALAITVTVIDPCADVTAPTATSPQPLTEGQTVADIVVTDVTGTLNWYADADLTIAVDETDVLTAGEYTFWVTQTVGDCTSDAIQIVVEVTLSRNAFDEASFRAYPNPVNELLTISYSKDISDVTVVNMLGQVVISQKVSSTDTQVDMSALPTGNYLVKVTVDGAVKTIKVVKQ